MNDLDQFVPAAHQTIDVLADFVGHMREGAGDATGYAPIAEIYENLELDRWLSEGGMTPIAYAEFLQTYLRYAARLHHPHYVAHQVSAPDFPGSLAMLVNGVINNPMAVYEMGPSGAAVEFALVNWMLRKVGWPEQPLPGALSSAGGHAAGVLTHGGSLGNLTALLAARSRVSPEAWSRGVPSDLAVMVPAVSHYSCSRAVSMLGLGAESIYPVPTTAYGVIDPDQLDPVYERIVGEGRRVMAVVANACSTATGLHDPLRTIGAFCQRHGIWYHVDACHGASALIAPKARKYLDGIELADSIVWDTHKMMQVPELCAAVLLKNAEDFERAFEQDADYLAWSNDGESYSAMPRAVECTKASLGLKPFLILAWRGEAALGRFVDERYAAAARFAAAIADRPGFTVPCAPESNIVCFRYGEDDGFQETVRKRLLRDRRFHLTSAKVDGRRYLRLTVMNSHTTVEHIDQLLTAIEGLAQTLS